LKHPIHFEIFLDGIKRKDKQLMKDGQFMFVVLGAQEHLFPFHHPRLLLWDA
jgi:hypothetical protein